MDQQQTSAGRSGLAAASGADRYRRIGRRAWLWTSVLVLLFFILWESAERQWIAQRAAPQLHALHLVRGIGASLAAAALVAWLMGRAAPVPSARAVSGDQWWARGQLSEEQWTRSYGRWFVLMRWIAVVVCLALTFFATHVTDLLPHELWVPLAITALVLAGCNVCYMLLIRWGVRWTYLLPAQIVLDLLLLTALLHYSGGIENPLSLVMVFHVIIAGIVLSRRQCYGVAAVASALYALLAVGEWAGLLPHYTLQTFPHHHGDEGMVHAAHLSGYLISSIAVQTVVLFLAAYFVTTLAERVRYDEQELSDMAERARSERQLLERAMETTGTGLRVLDRGMQPYWVNPQWKRLFAQAAPTQEEDSEAPLPASQPDAAPAQSTFDDGQVRVTEIIAGSGAEGAEDPAGQTYPRVVQLTTAPLLDEDGRVSQVVELAQDATHQRATQARLIRACRLAAMGELAGQVAHEVNNPIGIISAKARLLLDDHRQELSDYVAGELEKIAHQAQRVGRVAQGLLQYCRPSSRTRSPLDIRLPMSRALALVEQRARAAGVEIEARLGPQPPPVLGTADELEQVFYNLFTNALDAMPQGGKLLVEAQPRDGRLEIAVEDTGCGMPPQVRRRVFEPFFTTKTPGRGTGLGLAICQELIRSSGGGIDVFSEPGRGSRFIVKLPLASSAGAAGAHTAPGGSGDA